ncbi:MAG: thiamine-phosphate kinase [Pseudonocardia sp.]
MAEETVAELGEFGLIARVTRGRVQPPGTLLGPGDDAALLAAPDGRVVASTDVLVEGVHFRLDWSSPVQVGRKAAAVNLADVAAMGAVPTGLLVGLGCPPDTPAAVAEGLAAGVWTEASAAGTGLVGGDVVSAPVVLLSVTVLGSLRGGAPVTRSGARPGDVLAIAGRLGWSAAGLAVLAAGHGGRSVHGSPAGALGAVLDAHRVPTPPYLAGPAAAVAGATAMIDVSDGLLADVGHLAAASGVAVDVRSAALPVPDALAEVAGLLGADPVRWLLTGGEDHALVATFPPDTALPPGWRPIGAVRTGAGVSVDGLPDGGVAGWDHFAGPPGRSVIAPSGDR